jgi:hypothetical protein
MRGISRIWLGLEAISLNGISSIAKNPYRQILNKLACFSWLSYLSNIEVQLATQEQAPVK